MLPLLLLLSCRGPSGPPVTALITLDTWRLDHFSEAHSPVLWALSQKGRRYTNAWAPVGLTSPSHATMLSGAMPWEHGLRANNHHGFRLRADLPLVHEALGLRAGAFVSAYPAGPEGGLDRGFEVFSGPESGERAGEIAVAEALAWLPQDAPAFLWVHLYEPHGPYLGEGPDDPSRYAEEVARADAALEPLVDALLRRDARIVVAADHGEVLLEETCGRQHERSISAQVLHVPLFTVGPGVAPGEDDRLLGLADVPALLRGEEPPVRSYWLAESGLCEESCASGCAPPGLAGRDALVIDAGGRWVSRPGRGAWSEGQPDPAYRALLASIPPLPDPEAAAPEEARVLGYVE